MKQENDDKDAKIRELESRLDIVLLKITDDTKRKMQQRTPQLRRAATLPTSNRNTSNFSGPALSRYNSVPDHATGQDLNSSATCVVM